MGIVVEYANRTGAPRWIKPNRKPWDYTIFGDTRPVPEPVETIPLAIGKINGGTGGFNRWTINGKSFDENDQPRALQKGKRYRLVFDNQTDDPHPVHLHRNTFRTHQCLWKANRGRDERRCPGKRLPQNRSGFRAGSWKASRSSTATSNSTWITA